MTLTRTIAVTILGAALGAAPAFCADTVLVFEPASAEVHWTLDAFLHTVHGTFQLKSGTVTFDPDTGKASGRLVVSAASGESGNKSRDERMHKAVLESPKFPEIVFTPDRVEGKAPAQGSSTIQVHGSFNLLGANHEMTLPVQVSVEPSRITAETKFSVPYVRWGLKDPSTFVLHVADKVDIDIHAVGRLGRPTEETAQREN